MKRRLFAETCLVTCVVVCCANSTAYTQGMSLPWTALAEIDIKPPRVTGSLWLAADAVESLTLIDADGDVRFSRPELDRARPWLSRYLNEHFRIMWQGRVQPILLTAIDEERRGPTMRRYLRATFRVADYPPGTEVIILSDLLDDVSPQPACMALIKHKDKGEVFVFSREHYYTTHPSREPDDDTGIYRSPNERGRITPSATDPIEMLYAIPEGAFYLYSLMPDRYTPRPIAADAIPITITDAQEKNPRKALLTLAPMPLPNDPAGQASRFRVTAAEWMNVTSFKADMTLGRGDQQRRLIFDFPAVVTGAAAEPTTTTHYACLQLCLGVESTHAHQRCPRCGAMLIEARGDGVPGVGLLGLHGGAVTAMNSEGDWAEVVLVRPDELRLYRTGARMEERPIGELSGYAIPFRSETEDGRPSRLQFVRSENGTYLSARLTSPMYLPSGVRCVLIDGNAEKSILLELQVWEMQASPQPRHPTTTQPAAN